MSSLDQTNTVNNSNAIQDDWDDNALHNQNLKDIDLDDMDEDILDFGGEPDADDFFANSGNVDNADEESVDTDDLSFDDNVDVNDFFDNNTDNDDINEENPEEDNNGASDADDLSFDDEYSNDEENDDIDNLQSGTSDIMFGDEDSTDEADDNTDEDDDETIDFGESSEDNSSVESLFIDEDDEDDSSTEDSDPADNDLQNLDDMLGDNVEDFEEDLDAEDSESSDDMLDENNYNEGTIVGKDELFDDDEDNSFQDTESDFISDSGNIIVQDMMDETEEGFSLIYIDINKIAITHRIRNQSLDESLLKSIKSTGLLSPLTVAPTATEGLYVLLDGFRRIQACANAGIKRVPCIINNKVSTPEIPIIEAMYNIYRDYSLKEKIDCMADWDKNHGMRNAGMIEMLLKLNNGDYSKIQDILTDNDEDIVNKMLNGEYDVATAFRKLEQRRKKESAEEKDRKKAEQVYGDESESGIDAVAGAGEEGNEAEAMSADELESLATSVNNMDEAVEETSLNDMVEEGKQVEGYEPHQQKVGDREILDPAIRKAALARDNFTCRACKRGGEQYVDILDAHHVIPVYCGGVDSVDNTIMLCVACHRLVHLYATGDLTIPEALLKNDGWSELDEKQKERYENEQIFVDEQQRFKRIVFLGSKIRKKASAMGKSREQFKKEHPNTGIGRRKPGKDAPQEFA